MTSLPPILTPNQVAEVFAVDPKTVNVWADEGKIPCFRTPGGRRRFHREDIEAFTKTAAGAAPTAS